MGEEEGGGNFFFEGKQLHLGKGGRGEKFLPSESNTATAQYNSLMTLQIREATAFEVLCF